MSDAPTLKQAQQFTRPQVGELPEVICIKQTGTSVASGAVSASGAINATSNGDMPNRVRISATASAYVKLGTGTPTAVAGDMMVQPGDALIVDAIGFDHFAVLQVSAAGVVQVSPIEN